MRASPVLSFFMRPVVLIVAAALLIRLVLMPLLTYDFDIYHWALIASNIDSGNNLYDLDGYYYTPVWGYLVGFISTIQQFLVDIGPMGIRFTEMLPIEDLLYPFHIATITSIGFNISMKIPMIICDFAVGYLIYWLVKDRTGSPRKAAYGLAFWLFCPIVIYMSGVQSMFDTFLALLLMLAVIMFYKDKCFVGGMLFSAAVLLKFFPAFCIFVLLAYVLVKHKDDGLAKRKLLESISGMAVMTIVLMLPLILNGQVGDAFMFIFGRAGEASIFSTVWLLFNGMIAVLCMFFFGYLMYRTPPDKADRSMFAYVLFAAASAVLMSTTPQYVIMFVPFLILHMLAAERAFIKCWVIIGVAAFVSAFVLNNYSLFASLAAHTSLISPDWMLYGMQWLETEFFGINLVSLFANIATVLQYAGTLLLVLFGLADAIFKKFPTLGNIVLRIKGKEEEYEA
jgi:Gpi18-like mannosyltransferase